MRVVQPDGGSSPAIETATMMANRNVSASNWKCLRLVQDMKIQPFGRWLWRSTTRASSPVVVNRRGDGVGRTDG